MLRGAGGPGILHSVSVRGVRYGRVEVSCFFLLLYAWLLYRDHTGIVIQGLVACLLHEAGHCVALHCLGNGVKEISLTIFGARIIPEKSLGYGQEFWAAAAGPCVNLLLAWVFSFSPFFLSFSGVNLALAAFNLLPVWELDGARMARCVLVQVVSYEFTSKISVCLSFSFTALCAITGVVFAVKMRNLTMLLMCIWLVKRAADEKKCNFL